MSFMIGMNGPYEAFKQCKNLCMEAGPKRVVRNVAFVVSTSYGVVKVGKTLYKWYNFSYLRKQKREACLLSKQRLQERLKEVEDSSRWEEITTMSSTDLIHKLQKKELKAIDVLRAFQYKALQTDEELNCLVEPIWEAEAQALEEDLEGIKGPLHGIPVSLKDTYGVMGYDGTVGLASRINKPFLEDAVIVKVLKKAGAIPFVKTTSPPAMYSFETSSALYGRTCNPVDPNRIPGGSSGGEGALLARHGSIIGFGSDLGGSIRIPANMCGVFGFKPTIGRISKKGMSPLCRANQMVASSIGPMARDIEGLVSVMRALLVPYMYELDPNSVPILFQNEVYESKRPLRIGYYTYDGFIHAVPAMVRGVEVAKAALEKQGHTLVPWQPLKAEYAFYDMWSAVQFGDHGVGLVKELDGDKQDPCIAMLYYILKMRETIRKPLCHLLRLFSPGAARLLSTGMDYDNVYDWFLACRKLETYREDVATSWRQNKLDAVICPGFTMTAVPPGVTVFQQLAYTAIYNALNFPAGSVPVTQVTAEDEDKLEKEYPTEPFYHKITKEGSRGSTGLPVNVQCVALPFQDEMCLRVMKELDTALKMTT